jgi:hypothetical protein
MRTRNKFVIAVSITLLVTLTIVALNILVEANRNPNIYGSGHGSTINITISVDQTIAKYVNITTTGQSGAWHMMTFNGTANWIGAPQDRVSSLKDIHLTAYTRLDQNATWSENTYMLYNGFCIAATPNGTTIPTNAIGHREIMILALCSETPIFPFSFTLTIYD